MRAKKFEQQQLEKTTPFFKRMHVRTLKSAQQCLFQLNFRFSKFKIYIAASIA